MPQNVSGRSRGAGAAVLPWHGLGLHLLATPPCLPGGSSSRNLADGDSEAVRTEELRRGPSHAPLLCLPTVFLDLLWEGPGSAQAMAPQVHRDTDVDRPTQRDTSGTPGGRGTTSQSPQDPHRAPEMERTQPNPGPRPRACRERQLFRVCRSGRECQPSQSSRPITAHSPGTCAVRPGSSCEGQRSSCPALHPSPPACSLGTRPHEAPAEARGPKLLTAGPIPYQLLDFHIRPLYHALTTQGADSRPRARVTWGDGPWKAPPAPPRWPLCPSSCHL